MFGGLFAYAVYKMRERARKGGGGGGGGKASLQYFVEYELPATANAAPQQKAAAARKPIQWRMMGVFAGLTALLGGAGVYYYFAIYRVIQRGGWGDTSSGETSEFPTPPTMARAGRGPTPGIATSPRAPSLFPSLALDENKDGVLQPEERKKLHAEVPLTVFVTVDDNGDAQALRWLDKLFERRGLRGKVTFFLTGNYLEGRPSYLGGKMGAWWTYLAQENWIGIHGLSHGSGSDKWTVNTWLEENRTLMNEISLRVRPPEGWQWTTYPWGSRAPQLVATDAYFTSLEQISPAVVYDASLVVRPVSARAIDVRDVPWPFTLDRELIDEVVLPFAEGSSRRLVLGKHAILEVPVYAWAVTVKGELMWIPSTDLSYYEIFPCTDKPSTGGLAMFEDNLMAHQRGNRAPFHLGLHAQSYGGDKKCQRATLEALLDVLERVGGAAGKVRFEAIPPFLSRYTAGQ